MRPDSIRRIGSLTGISLFLSLNALAAGPNQAPAPRDAAVIVADFANQKKQLREQLGRFQDQVRACQPMEHATIVSGLDQGKAGLDEFERLVQSHVAAADTALAGIGRVQIENVDIDTGAQCALRDQVVAPTQRTVGSLQQNLQADLHKYKEGVKRVYDRENDIRGVLMMRGMDLRASAQAKEQCARAQQTLDQLKRGDAQVQAKVQELAQSYQARANLAAANVRPNLTCATQARAR